MVDGVKYSGESEQPSRQTGQALGPLGSGGARDIARESRAFREVRPEAAQRQQFAGVGLAADERRAEDDCASGGDDCGHGKVSDHDSGAGETPRSNPTPHPSVVTAPCC